MSDLPGRVLLAFPSTGHDLSTRFMRSFVELEAFDRENGVQMWEALGAPESPNPIELRLLDNYVAIESTSNLAKARNRLCVEFLDNYPDCDWLWFVDSDMTFQPDTLHRLVATARHHDVKIIGALCVLVTADGAIPTMFIDDTNAVTRVMLDYTDDQLAEVAATGTGCLLVHRSVLKDMRERAGGSNHAWFGYDVHATPVGEYETGEDVSFCLRARKAGHRIFVDTTIHAGHHKGPKTWMPEDCRKHPVSPEQLQRNGDEAFRDTAS
jgi:hypothetical protein